MNGLLLLLRQALKCGVGVLLFLSLIQPFGIDTLKEGRLVFIAGETSIAVFSVFMSLLLVSVIMHGYDKQNSSLKTFLLHEALVNAVNIPMLAVLLLAFNDWFNSDPLFSFLFCDGHFTLRFVIMMCGYVGAVSVFLFFWQFYQYRNDKLRRELEDVKAINMLLERRQEKLEEHVDEDVEEKTDVKVVIEGQGIGARLEVDPRDILYVESMANYADIYYISDNETRHLTLRITLKQIKETLSEYGYIVQCHRAFLVNINFVVSMTARNPGYQLQLFGVEKQLPVSRANNEVIKQALSEK